MRLLTCWMFLLAMATASACVGAETTFDAAARAKAIAAVVEEEIAVVAHVDLSRVAPEELMDFLNALLPSMPPGMRKTQQEVEGCRDKLLRASAKDGYLVAPPLYLYNAPVQVEYVIPVSSGDQEKAVRAALRLRQEEGRLVENALVISTWRRTDFQPAKRPELAAAFEAAGDTAAQLILIPPADTQRVVGELMPQLPKELGGGPSSVLTRGVSWAAVGIDLSPKKALRLVIKSEDAQAARALHAKLIDLAHAVGQQAQVRQWWPEFDEAITLLMPKVEGDRLILVVDEKDHNAVKVWDVLKRPIEKAQRQAARHESVNNLKQIGLAMHNYYDGHKQLPLPGTLLSWRVLLLPYLDENGLYKQFHLDEAWDSPHNRTLIDKMPAIYRLPVSKSKEKGLTNYLLPVGNGAAFTADKPTQFKDISDGTSHTIMAIEVDDEQAVTWTKPDDWPFDPKEPAKGLGHFFEGGFNATFCDGSVRTLPIPKDPKGAANLRAMFTRAGGETIER